MISSCFVLSREIVHLQCYSRILASSGCKFVHGGGGKCFFWPETLGTFRFRPSGSGMCIGLCCSLDEQVFDIRGLAHTKDQRAETAIIIQAVI